MKLTAYDSATTPGTQPRKNIRTMEKVDKSGMFMITKWVIDISSPSPKLESVSLTRTTPYIAKKIRKVT